MIHVNSHDFPSSLRKLGGSFHFRSKLHQSPFFKVIWLLTPELNIVEQENVRDYVSIYTKYYSVSNNTTLVAKKKKYETIAIGKNYLIQIKG